MGFETPLKNISYDGSINMYCDNMKTTSFARISSRDEEGVALSGEWDVFTIRVARSKLEHDNVD